MIAYKFLAEGARGRFSGVSWPVPSARAPGAWLEPRGPLRPCERGIHACRLAHLAYWIDAELWQIELEGEQVERATLVVAERGRLLSKVHGWGPAAQSALGAFAVARAEAAAARVGHRPGAERARQWCADARALWRLGQVASAAYVSAAIAHLPSELPPEQAFAAERALQATFLATLLDLS